MRDHLKILGWLYVVSGGFMLLVGVGCATVFGMAGAFSGRGEDALVAGGIGALVLGIMAVLSLPAIVLGWGLLAWKPWSRVLGIVLSILHLFSFPLGTLIGGYGLWVLLNEESRQLLERGDPRLRSAW
ncbi:hypothetical protein [Longimicrobium sp.]|uniref:hypothetical protein n=1 Tax=Longimicrobium sp. TaxID=2029185 RepID=UPI002BEB69F9|nr:hypothetical protein [Longimicrobium sp.]HSU16020.1 hypothetical protein [Longimicrobium sp.]